MGLVEDIASHLHQSGKNGNEGTIYWIVRNEFIERTNDKPSQEDILATIKLLKELKAQDEK